MQRHHLTPFPPARPGLWDRATTLSLDGRQLLEKPQTLKIWTRQKTFFWLVFAVICYDCRVVWKHIFIGFFCFKNVLGKYLPCCSHQIIVKNEALLCHKFSALVLHHAGLDLFQEGFGAVSGGAGAGQEGLVGQGRRGWGRAGGAGGAGQEGIMRSCPDSTFLASGRLVNILCSD